MESVGLLVEILITINLLYQITDYSQAIENILCVMFILSLHSQRNEKKQK